ncbi:MAG: DUF1285 domain-containing protein [Halioglobus sp.]|nr:DUF1285 domain-containing protein [Halioglobus sp.]
MTNHIDELAAQVSKERDFDAPPLHLWEPPLSGDIDIEIDREGRWYHEGTHIERESLVRLFASILRRESDGEYYLVTPVEKWRIRVPFYPLLVVDVEEQVNAEGEVQLDAVLNTTKVVPIVDEDALFLDPAADHIAALRLPHGLTALFSRAAWYRLVERAEESAEGPCVVSGGRRFSLSPPG